MVRLVAFTTVASACEPGYPVISREDEHVALDIVLTPGEVTRMLLSVELEGEAREVGSVFQLFAALSRDSAVESVEIHATADGFDERVQFDRASTDEIDFSELIRRVPSGFESEIEATLVSGGAGEVEVYVIGYVGGPGKWEADLRVTLEELP